MNVDERTVRLRLNQEDGDVTLDAWLDALGGFNRVLHGLEQDVPPEQRVTWRVTGLELGSAVAVLTAMGNPVQAQARPRLLMRALHSLERGETLPEGFPPRCLEAACDLVEDLARAKAHLSVAHGADQERLTERTLANGRTLLRTIVWQDYGSVDGALEMVNVHDTSHFYLYERNTGCRVRCSFKLDQIEGVRRSLGRAARVWGVVRYNRQGELLGLQVQGIEALPDSSSLPRIDDIIGIAPDITGGVSAEDHVRRLRDGH
jgi:hypothetical protein